MPGSQKKVIYKGNLNQFYYEIRNLPINVTSLDLSNQNLGEKLTAGQLIKVIQYLRHTKEGYDIQSQSYKKEEGITNINLSNNNLSAILTNKLTNLFFFSPFGLRFNLAGNALNQFQKNDQITSVMDMKNITVQWQHSCQYRNGIKKDPPPRLLYSISKSNLNNQSLATLGK